MHVAKGPEVQGIDHPALNLTTAREVITVMPGNQTISVLIQRPASVINSQLNSAQATDIMAKGFSPAIKFPADPWNRQANF